MNRECCTPSIPPTRALRIGLTRTEVCAWYKLTEEQLDELSDCRRRPQSKE